MQNMLPNEDLPAAPDAIRIKLEGPRIDPVRAVRRCVVAIKCADDADMATCESIKIDRGQTVLVETYVDRLPAIAERTRTDAHRRAWAQAVEINEMHRTEEAGRRQRERGTVPAAVGANDDYLNARGKTWNGHPSIHLALLGYRTGIPPVESCEVVHPTDTSAPRIEVHAFLQLPEADRMAYTIDPPLTPLNASARANEQLAKTLTDAFAAIADAKAKK